MGSPLATFYGSDRAASAIGTRSDLVFHASLTIDNTVATPQVVALSPIGAGIDLGRLPGSVAAYLSIKQAVVSTRKNPSFSDKHRGPVHGTQAYTVPATSSPLETFNFTPTNPAPTFLTHIGFFSAAAANLTVAGVQAKPHSAASYLGLDAVNLVAPIPAVGNVAPQVDVTRFYDPFDGMINFDGTGFDIQFTAINTAGVSQGITIFAYGSYYAFDWTQLLVNYIDWYGQSYNIGIFDDRAFSQPFGLGQKIPFPITNENQTNFGSLSFTVLGSNSSFNTQYTYDVILNASLEYQLG